jgi:hypothetical protein
MDPLAQGTYSAQGAEKLDYSYFDSHVLAATGTEVSMFQSPIGAGGKTISDTNMSLGGTLPRGQNFKIRAIRAEILGHAAYATATIMLLYNWMRTVTVRLFITGKDALYSKPLTEVMGIPMLINVIPTAAGDNIGNLSLGRFLGINPLNVPITFAELTNFEVRLNWPTAIGATAIVGDIIRISLNGILLRRN